MEAVYLGKQFKDAIKKKIKEYENDIDQYVEQVEFDSNLLKAAKEEYDSKGCFFKLFHKRPTLDAIRGITKDNYIFFNDLQLEIALLEGKIKKLKKLDNSIKDDTQIILNEQDILYYKIKE